jgi:hypothetical protein
LRGSEPTTRPKRAGKSASAASSEDGVDGESKEGDSVLLIDVVVETICSCNDFADDGVQLQVIKALLTAITTDHCETINLAMTSFYCFQNSLSKVGLESVFRSPSQVM